MNKDLGDTLLVDGRMKNSRRLKALLTKQGILGPNRSNDDFHVRFSNTTSTDALRLVGAACKIGKIARNADFGSNLLR